MLPVLPTLLRLRASLFAAWTNQHVRWGFLASVLMAVGAHTPLFLPQVNPVAPVPGLRWILSAEGSVVATAVLLAGTIGLVTAWLRIRPREGGGAPSQRAALAWWSVPLLVAPPLYSHDAYSYAAVGWMHHLGLNPYDMGPGSVSGAFRQQVDPYWLLTPTPYGPMALEVQRWLVVLTGEHPYLSAVAMRLMALVGVALMAWCLPRLARWVGVQQEVALWWGLSNPLVVLHFVGGAHNDALMVGVVTLALWMCTRRSPWQALVLSAVLVAVATAIKQPAGVALLGTTALCTARMHPQLLGRGRASLLPTEGEPWLTRAVPDLRRLLGPSCVAAVLFAATFALITWATDLGYGWIPALSVPGMAAGLSPVSLVGGLLVSMVSAIGLESAAPVIRGVLKACSVLATLAVVGLAALRVLRIGGIAFTAWALLAVALLGQTVHPWYVLWGLPLLPLAGMRPEVERVAFWGTFGVIAHSLFDTGTRSGQVVLGIAAVIVLFLVFRDAVHPHEPDEGRSLELVGEPTAPRAH